jgi:hypothetical protein
VKTDGRQGLALYFGGKHRLHLQGRIRRAKKHRKRRWQAGSTLKMEAMFSSEMSVDFQRTTRRYIPEDTTLQQAAILQVRYR